MPSRRDGRRFGTWLPGDDRGSSVVHVRPQGTALLERGMWKVAEQSRGPGGKPEQARAKGPGGPGCGGRSPAQGRDGG